MEETLLFKDNNLARGLYYKTLGITKKDNI